MKLKITMFEIGTPKVYRQIRPTPELSGIASRTNIEIRRPIDHPKMIRTSIAPKTKLDPSTRNMIEISSDVSRVVEKSINGYCDFRSSTRLFTARAVPSVLISLSL